MININHNSSRFFKRIMAGIFSLSVGASSAFLIPHKVNCDSESVGSVTSLNAYHSDMDVNIANLDVQNSLEQYEFKSSNKTAYINSNAVVIRKEASDESEVIFSADYASKVYIMGEDINQSDGWTKVYLNNVSGFVRTEYISYDMLFVPEARYIYISGQTELRSEPNAEEDNIVQMLEQNNRFKQTGYNDDWIQIEANDRFYYLSSGFTSNNMIFIEDEKSIYLNRGSYLKTQPFNGEKYNSDIWLDRDSKISQVEYNESWVKILYDDKYYYIEKSFTTPYLTTYVQNSYTITFDDTVYSGDIAVVLERAYSFLGQSYVWGAASPAAMDCSGLTMQCYASVGIALPHQSAQQAKYGRDVMNEALKPGDLLMFSSRWSSHISHVGIYVGDGMMIHASNSRDGVIASDLGRYCENGGVMRAARRMIEE